LPYLVHEKLIDRIFDGVLEFTGTENPQ